MAEIVIMFRDAVLALLLSWAGVDFTPDRQEAEPARRAADASPADAARTVAARDCRREVKTVAPDRA